MTTSTKPAGAHAHTLVPKLAKSCDSVPSNEYRTPYIAKTPSLSYPNWPRAAIHFLATNTAPRLSQKTPSQVVAAAEAWCLALGSDRPEDIAFVKAEIRKAWTAAEPRRIEVTEKKGTTTVGKDEQLPADTSGVGSLGAEVDSTMKREGRGERVAVESRRRGGEGGKMTVESPLATDVEAGTSLFWVKVWCGSVRCCDLERLGGGTVCGGAVGFGEVLCGSG